MGTLRDGAVDVVRRLRDAGCTAFWVGGCVRDLEMGREPHDYDIVTDARPERVTSLLDRAVLVGAEFGVVAVSSHGHQYEVATFRTEGPYLDGRRPSSVKFATAEDDVRRRDFTINGLLHDPLSGKTSDYVDGRQDIRRRIIRTIGTPQERFAEDYLRMLRAVRLAAELDFTIEAETFRAIAALAPSVERVSAERIRDELLRLLVAPGRSNGVRLLDESGLLRIILPEVTATKGVEQPPEFHPEGDVFTHTLLALKYLRNPSPELALATLLHDVGKPPTMTRVDRIRFNNHDDVGAQMAETICRRLRCSNEQVDRVVSLVQNHLRMKDLPKMRQAKAARFLLQPDAADHLELHRVDCQASHGDLSVWEWAVKTQQELAATKPLQPRLLSGDDLIQLGFPPGPKFKEILDYVEDAQLEGQVHSYEEAMALVRRVFPAEPAVED
ncbi:MAG TPA: CCA tRNA nucleotidyltransferase [bacterium]|nr:CCA tRNA nucleotidyltransferase [bacterium]